MEGEKDLKTLLRCGWEDENAANPGHDSLEVFAPKTGETEGKGEAYPFVRKGAGRGDERILYRWIYCFTSSFGQGTRGSVYMGDIMLMEGDGMRALSFICTDHKAPLLSVNAIYRFERMDGQTRRVVVHEGFTRELGVIVSGDGGYHQTSIRRGVRADEGEVFMLPWALE